MTASPLYAYAICAQCPETLPQGCQASLTIIAAANLYLIAEPGLDVRELSEAELITAAVNHDRVLCELPVPILPIRFGTHFEGVAIIEQHLRDHTSTYQQRLAQLRDRSEYCLKLIPQEPDLPEATGTGRAYFAAKKARVERLNAWQTAQAQAKAEWEARLRAVQAVVQTDDTSLELKAYFLLEPSAIAAWQNLDDPYWHLELTGPLPPYHFV